MRSSHPSGIRPAPYALPRGTPALQDPPHQRRLLASLALSAVLVAGTAGFLMGRSEPLTPDRESPVQARAEELARGPLARLLSEHDRFLTTEAPADPAYWHGVRRLLRSVLADEEHPSPELMSRLRRAILEGEPPEDVLRLAPLLDHRLQLVSR